MEEAGIISEYEFTENKNSFSMRKKKNYILSGFDSKEAVDKWIQDLSGERKYIQRNRFILEAEAKQYGITVSEAEIAMLADEERNRLIDLPIEPMVTPYTPWVYRFMGEEYVDRFLKTGELRLCTFESCSKLEDSKRRDKGEGETIIVGESGKNKLCIMGKVGGNILMLCSSLVEKCKDDEGQCYRNGIIIKNILGFMLDVTSALEREGYHVEQMLMGPCNYTSNKRINRRISDTDVKDKIENKTVCLSEVYETFASCGQDDIFFRKLLDKADEHEYRMIWRLNQNLSEDHYSVVVPEAIQHCEKYRFVE